MSPDVVFDDLSDFLHVESRVAMEDKTLRKNMTVTMERTCMDGRGRLDCKITFRIASYCRLSLHMNENGNALTVRISVPSLDKLVAARDAVRLGRELVKVGRFSRKLETSVSKWLTVYEVMGS